MNSENSRPKHCLEGLGVIWPEQTCVAPEDMIGKVQTYLTPKNVNEVQAFVGILQLEGFLFPIWHNASVLYTTW